MNQCLAMLAGSHGMCRFDVHNGLVVNSEYLTMPEENRPTRVDVVEYTDFFKGRRPEKDGYYDILAVSYWTKTGYVDALNYEGRRRRQDREVAVASSFVDRYGALTEQEKEQKVKAMISRITSENDE